MALFLFAAAAPGLAVKLSGCEQAEEGEVAFVDAGAEGNTIEAPILDVETAGERPYMETARQQESTPRSLCSSLPGA